MLVVLLICASVRVHHERMREERCKSIVDDLQEGQGHDGQSIDVDYLVD
jgi:hypothetical protein